MRRTPQRLALALGISLALGLLPALPASASGSTPLTVTLASASAPIEDTTKDSARRWALPLDPKKGYRLSSPQGPRCIPVVGGSTHHLGQDLGSQNGDPIYAVTDGVVRKTLNGTSAVSGQIILKHNIGGKVYETAYLHMWNASTHVKEGQKIKAGQQIGVVGSSGPSTGPHLHLEVWKERFYSNDANLLDPAAWLSAQGISLAKNASLIYPQTPPSSCTYYARGMIDVFATADSGSSVVAKIPRNALISSKPGAINGKINGNYVKVTYGKNTGWIDRYAATPYRMGDAPAGSLTSAGADTNGMLLPIARYRANGTANLRTGTATWYSVMGQVKAGSVVDVYQSKSGWLRISHAGKIGWVSAPLFTWTATLDPAVAKPTRETVAATVLRKGAAVTQTESGKIAAGTQVAIRRSLNGWMEVQAGQTTGWVPASALKAIGAPTPTPPVVPAPPVEKPKPVAAKATHITTNGLNLRQGPSASTTSLKVLVKGTEVAVVATQNTWRQVQAGPNTGWVAAQYLQAIKPTVVKPVQPAGPKPPAKPKPKPKPVVVKPKPVVVKPQPSAKPAVAKASHTTTNGLNLRQKPDVKSKSVRVLAKGTKVALLKAQGKWRYVQVGTSQGWVAGNYLKLIKPAAPKVTTVAKKTYKTKVKLTVRQSASTKSKALKVLPKGAKVTVSARSGSWLRFAVASRTGWAPASQLVEAKPAKKTVAVKPAKSKMKTAKSKVKTTIARLNLRAGASTAQKSLLLVPVGKKLTVQATKGSWAKVSYGKKTGWVHSGYLK